MNIVKPKPTIIIVDSHKMSEVGLFSKKEASLPFNIWWVTRPKRHLNPIQEAIKIRCQSSLEINSADNKL